MRSDFGEKTKKMVPGCAMQSNNHLLESIFWGSNRISIKWNLLLIKDISLARLISLVYSCCSETRHSSLPNIHTACTCIFVTVVVRWSHPPTLHHWGWHVQTACYILGLGQWKQSMYFISPIMYTDRGLVDQSCYLKYLLSSKHKINSLWSQWISFIVGDHTHSPNILIAKVLITCHERFISF